MEDIIWLKVPYGKKYFAKRAGARFDRKTDLWKIASNLPLGKMYSWVIKTEFYQKD